MNDRNLVSIDVFKDVSHSVEVDWDQALNLCDSIDSEDNYLNGELPFCGKAAIRLLAEYGVLAKAAAGVPPSTKLCVVVWPPSVYFCPSTLSDASADGVFVEPYCKEKHGFAIEYEKEFNVWEFSSVHAVRDGWTFSADMINQARKLRRNNAKFSNNLEFEEIS